MKRDRRAKIIIIVGTALLILACAVSLCVGSYPVSLKDILLIFTGRCEETMKINVILKLRLPRLIMAVLAGVMLGVSGGVFQIVFKNQLASPDILGISSGATAGVAVITVIGIGGIGGVVFGAFAGAMLAMAFVLILVRLTGKYRTSTYILAGIIVSALSKAFIMLLKVMADSENEIAAIEFWTMGSFGAVTLNKLPVVAACVAVALIVIFLMRNEILLLGLSEEHASYMGLNTKRAQIIILTAAVLGVAAVTSRIGVIAFAGLLAPHIAYLFIRKKTGAFLPFCGITGAVILVCADILVKGIKGFGELPVSIFTTALAAPMLVLMLIRTRRDINDQT
ncbi:MAG: FecCD family ABC transporter permease [Butyrivibrio sp.]